MTTLSQWIPGGDVKRPDSPGISNVSKGSDQVLSTYITSCTLDNIRIRTPKCTLMKLNGRVGDPGKGCYFLRKKSVSNMAFEWSKYLHMLHRRLLGGSEDIKLYYPQTSWYTVKNDTLNLVDMSMSNCTNSWQLLGVIWNITLKFNFIYQL